MKNETLTKINRINNDTKEIFRAYTMLCNDYGIDSTFSKNFVKVVEKNDLNIIDYPYVASSIFYRNDHPFVFVFKKPHTSEKSIIENSIILSIREFVSNCLANEEIKNISKENSQTILHEKADLFISKYVGALLLNSLNTINELSKEKYEQRNCNGYIKFILLNSSKMANIIDLNLESESSIIFSLKNKKMLRKLLEASNENLLLSVYKNDKQNTLICGGYVEKAQEGITLHFLNFGAWEILNEKNEKIISFNNGRYFIEKPFTFTNNQKLKIEKYINEVHANFSVSTIENLIEKYAFMPAGTFHGALFVFTNDESYANNMNSKSRAIGIKNNIKMQNSQIIKQLSIVDGALVFNTNGELLTFSTILDGCVVSKGDSSRGSRFNSSKTFTEYYNNTKGGKYFAISLSEDGDISVFDGQINKTD